MVTFTEFSNNCFKSSLILHLFGACFDPPNPSSPKGNYLEVDKSPNNLSIQQTSYY